MLMSGEEYRDSLRRYRPKVWLDGAEVPSVADEPRLAPGVNALALTYDLARREELAPLTRTGDGVNRMLAVPRSTDDLLNKLEAVRLVCQHTGCAQRFANCHGSVLKIGPGRKTRQSDGRAAEGEGLRTEEYCPGRMAGTRAFRYLRVVGSSLLLTPGYLSRWVISSGCCSSRRHSPLQRRSHT